MLGKGFEMFGIGVWLHVAIIIRYELFVNLKNSSGIAPLCYDAVMDRDKWTAIQKAFSDAVVAWARENEHQIERGVTKREWARSWGVSQGQVYNIIKGTKSPKDEDTRRKIALDLGLDYEKIIGVGRNMDERYDRLQERYTNLSAHIVRLLDENAALKMEIEKLKKAPAPKKNAAGGEG